MQFQVSVVPGVPEMTPLEVPLIHVTVVYSWYDSWPAWISIERHEVWHGADLKD